MCFIEIMALLFFRKFGKCNFNKKKIHDWEIVVRPFCNIPVMIFMLFIYFLLFYMEYTYKSWN